MERRTDHRFDTDLSVISSDKEGLTFGFIRNLSKSGAYIEMKKPIPVGLPFTFTLAHANLQSQIFGRVVRVFQDATTSKVQGVAVKFATVQGHDRFVRDDLLLYAMTKKYMEIWDNDKAINE